ncbi:MAG: cellulase family glycosylhydrolase [Oscillospiraceae bacterium]|nr:cellulase family glycosylhydrolase [Oscillospiraceae bacterium]
MKHNQMFRLGGTALAAVLLLSQLTALSAGAAEQTTKDITVCDYVQTFDKPIEIVQGTPVDVKPGDAGVPADKPVNQVWLDVTMDASSGLPAMPAIGYTTDMYVNDDGDETTWAGGGLWMQTAVSEATIIIEIPEDKPLNGDLQVQIWGEAGESVDKMNLNAIGYMTGDGGTIAPMTRKGDVNNDKTVDIKDVQALADYLVNKSDKLEAAGNADFDHNNRLTAADLTLLKRGILDGSLTKTSTTTNDETAMEFVSHIKIGWNLGNTLDAQSVNYPKSTPSEFESSWGCPVTTKQMIDKVKEAGFNCVRVPVSWGQKMDKNTYKINDAWMNRVQEVVNYVIENDMYCILNIHHDNDPADYPHFYPNSANYAISEKFVNSVWEQVSERFEAYDNHLIFETLNEPRLIGHNNEWWIDSNNNDCKDAMNCVNKLNAAALSTIRKSGGNNAKRFVMMPSYAANCDESTLAGVQMPNDDHIIAEAHAYTPYNFALAGDADGGTPNWSEANGGGDIINLMKRLQKYYLSKGIPVIIDEFGASNRNNEDTRAAWAKFYVSQADSYGIPCVLWDNNQFGTGSENLGLINRNNLSIAYPKLLEGLMEGAKNRGK